MSERPLKVKCIHDDGCQFWTEGNEYPAKFCTSGFLMSGSLMIGDDDNPDAEWFVSLTDDSEFYTVDGLEYFVQFALLSTVQKID